MGVSAEQIKTQLDQIVDPCSAVAGVPAGLVELGLVRALEVEATPAGAVIQVRIGVTEPGCMMGASFAIGARERLERLDGVASVSVELDHAGDWEPTDMDPGYADRLAAVRAARRTALRRAMDIGRNP